MTVTFYTRRGCPMCLEAELLVRRMQAKIGFTLRTVDIDEDPDAHDRYFERVPVVLIDGREVCAAPVDEERLMAALQS